MPLAPTYPRLQSRLRSDGKNSMMSRKEEAQHFLDFFRLCWAVPASLGSGGFL